jgi:hypothetical protein
MASAIIFGARARGDGAEATEQFCESLKMYQEMGAPWGIADSLEGLAGIASDSRQFECAAQLFGSAAALRETAVFPLASPNVVMQQRELEVLREALGSNSFEAAWQMGREQPVSDAVAAALGITSHETGKPIPAPVLHHLHHGSSKCRG